MPRAQSFIAIYINCVHGKFIPVGPFDSEDEAADWIHANESHDLTLWEVMPVHDQTDPPPEYGRST